MAVNPACVLMRSINLWDSDDITLKATNPKLSKHFQEIFQKLCEQKLETVKARVPFDGRARYIHKVRKVGPLELTAFHTAHSFSSRPYRDLEFL